METPGVKMSQNYYYFFSSCPRYSVCMYSLIQAGGRSFSPLFLKGYFLNNNDIIFQKKITKQNLLYLTWLHNVCHIKTSTLYFTNIWFHKSQKPKVSSKCGLTLVVWGPSQDFNFSLPPRRIQFYLCQHDRGTSK